MNETIEITLDQWRLHPSAYLMADIRDDAAYTYGHVPGAEHLPLEQLMDALPELPMGKQLLLCCKNGEASLEAARKLRAKGCPACSFAPGYLGWLQDRMEHESVRAADIEKSIRKKFHRTLWSRFAKAIREYELVKPGDCIAVCISGGKDSMLLSKLFQELKRHNKFPFEVKFLVMDPGYSPANRAIIEQNLRTLDIPAHIFESRIFDSVFHVEKSPCYLCARMRRGYLYKEAQKLGCNKIALGHHFDDVIETNLMGMLFGGQVQTMMPKLHSTNHPGMELIRPMYFIREDDIKHWRDYNGLYFLQCACKFTEMCNLSSEHGGPSGSKRQETKQLIRQLKQTSPQVEYNIFHALENINLGTALGWKDQNGFHSFLDDYDHPSPEDIKTSESED